MLNAPGADQADLREAHPQAARRRRSARRARSAPPGSTSSSTSSRRPPIVRPRRPRPPEQHLLGRACGSCSDNGVEVLVPPLHHQLVTATVETGAPRTTPQRKLEAGAGRPRAALPADAGRARGHRRLGPAVLPPLRPGARATYLPVDRRAREAGACSTRSASRATRPTRSSSRTTSPCSCAATASTTSPTPSTRSSTRRGSSGATSIRKGFAGGGFDGGESLPKQMAMAAGVAGADLIPEHRRALPRLHLDAEGEPRAGADREPRDARPRVGPDGYFRQGTHMHVSHIFEDLEAWYLNFATPSASHRVPPRPRVKSGTLTVPQGPADVATTADDVARLPDARRDRAQRVDPDDLAPARRTSSARTGRSTRRAPRSRSGRTSTRSTTRSSGASTRSADGMARRRSRRPLRRLQPDERRLPPQPAGDGRRAAGRDEAAVRARTRAARGSTRC